MMANLAFTAGYVEGREWAVNWAGEDVLKRLAAGSPVVEADDTGEWERPAARSTNRVLEELTTYLLTRPLPPPEVRRFWKQALPDADPASLHDLRFLSGFLAGARYIAQEPL